MQLRLFADHEKADIEALPRTCTTDIDLANTGDVFQAILKRVGDSQQELSFLSLLRRLLKIDSGNESLSESIKQAIEQLVSKTTTLDSEEDARKILNTISRRIGSEDRNSSVFRLRKETSSDGDDIPQKEAKSSETSVYVTQVKQDYSTMSAIPPPPPPPPGTLGGPPPPPPPPGSSAPYSSTAPTLPQINVPKPRSKMKTLQWQKIPVNNVIGKANIWTIISHLDKKYEMDYEKMDELFSLSHDAGSKRLSQDPDGATDSKKKRENMEVNILDGKRSLNVNIFLKQFRMEHKELVQLIREGRCEKFGAERLKSLLKLLPSQEEIDALNAYSGDHDKLGNAEKFLLCLMKLPNYRMRVEGLLIMEEFNINMEWIRPSIEAVIQAARDIQENQSLKELIFLILISGNYLNSGNYAGNAAGFKLSSLLKLTEIRANNPRINLMHYVAQEAEMKNPRLLKFPEEMAFLKDASQVSIEALATDISNIASKVRAITEQIVLAGADFQQQMAFFLKEANVEVTELEDDLNDIDLMRQELAAFFCEDIKTFKLEESFRILQTFCERLRQATEENIQRRIQETKTDRRKSKEPETQLYSKDITEPGHQAIDRGNEHNKGSIVDMLLADVRSGFTSRKFNEGNFSVTKVTKVNLGPADMVSPTTSTSPTPESTAQRRIRKSDGVDNGESLLEYLMEAANSAAKPTKSESHLERYANLRKRRLERKAKQRVVKIAEMERECVSSRSVADIKSSTPMGQSLSQGKDGDRSKSESLTDKKGSHTLRRTQSLLDRSSVEKANLERRSTGSKDDTDKSDALIRRLRQRLGKTDGRNTPSISEEGEGMMGVAYNHSVIKNAESFENENLTGNDDLTPNVMVSMRKKISSGMGTDIDGILKTIEDTGRQIDTVGVTGPMKRTPDATIKGAPTQPQVAVVAHVAASDSSNMAMSEKDLKAKRDKRKKRSTLSLDDVKAAMKLTNEKTSTTYLVNSTSSSDHTNSSFPTSRNPTSPKQKSVNNSDKAESTAKTVRGDIGSSKEFDKAAKLAAARKKFRGARFGVSGASDISNSNRARSNVEYESVDQALKEIACQSSMNRSKSYDEHVAKKLAAEGEFASNSIMKMNSSSAPGTSAEKRAVMRNSLSRLSMDGRRNGLYIPSDDSDTELKPEDIGTRRSSKSDSPKSFSQLSLKSTNTSTETLQSELEPSGEQNIRKSEPSSHSIPISNNTKSNTPRSNDFSTNAPATAKLDSPLHRSYSLLERSKNILEESDSPLAAVAKWRIKRAQNRKSVYDNVNENKKLPDSVSSTIHGHIYHSKLEENESKNDDGSRNSYASSNDRDEGFETASGTMSQRTSMNSNLEAEMYNTPTMSRRTEGQKSKGVAEGQSHIKSVINTSKMNDSVLSRLSEEADRKERTENWTEQFVRININNESRSETDREFNNALSPDSGLSTSKEDIWNENLATASSKTGKPSSPASRQKKSTTEEAAMPARPKAVPSYMLPTSSSSSKPDRSKLSTSTKADTAATVSPFRRDSNIRASTRNQETASTFKRDNVRASMRAESAAASFQRGTVARTSIRGPRSSIGHSTSSPQSNLSSPSHGRVRSDSTASVSSTTSSASNISATPSSVSEATRHRLDPVSNARSSPHNRRPVTPSSHLTTPVHRPTHQTTSLSSSPPTRAVAPASHSKASVTPVSSGFSRSMSLRVTPTRTSLGNGVKHNTDNRRSIVLPSNDGRRSVTSFLNERSPNMSPQLPERPHSTTPMSSDSTSSRRSSFMAPTASSRAKLDEQAPVAPPRTKSLRGASNTSPLTRSASLRVPARSTNGRESPVNAEQHYHHKPEYNQSLTTVTEQAGDEQKAEEHVKKSTSLLQRIGIGKSKPSSVAGAKSPLTKK